MVKEMLTVHVGQAGVQASQALWELVCLEHGVTAEGLLGASAEQDAAFSGEHLETVFYRTEAARCVPRAILLDLEPTVVDEIRLGSYRDMWNPNNILNQKEDAASNFARGYYTSGKSFIILVLDRISKELERCENLSAFEIVHSFAGGTGSGFTALLFETINELYGKKFKFSLSVFPSPTVSEIMVEAYNTVLHTSSTLANEDCVVAFDNESLFKKSLLKFNVQQPTFSLMNRLISQMFSSISLSHRYRFFGSQHADVTELLTNLVPYPRIHFPIMSYSPLMSFTEKSHEQFSCSRLTNDVFLDDSHVMQCSLKDNKFMSCCMLYRGFISPKPVIDAIAKIKGLREITFVDWCPTGFKIGINTCPPIQIPHCEQAIGDNALCMISGNTAIRGCWANVTRKFDMLMSKRAFVHWYVGEGLEEGEFLDSRENIQTLILDYEELSNQGIDTSSNDMNENNNVQANKYLNGNNDVPLNERRTIPVLTRLEKMFKLQNNQSYQHEDDSVHDRKQETKKKVLKGKILNKSFSKPKTIKSSEVSSNINEDSKHSDNTCIEDVLSSNKIVVSESQKKHERNRTINLDVKNINEIITDVLTDSEKSNKKQFTYPRKAFLHDNKNSLLTASNTSTCQSFTSNRCEFLEKYQLMKNNNKTKSFQNSSSTESFKSIINMENKIPVNFIRKSKSKWKFMDELLYNTNSNTNNTRDLRVNVVELCKSVSDNYKKVKNLETTNSLHPFVIKNSPRQLQNSLNFKENPIFLIKKLKNNIENSTDVETKISQDFKIRNLNFCLLKTFSCDPAKQ